MPRKLEDLKDFAQVAKILQRVNADKTLRTIRRYGYCTACKTITQYSTIRTFSTFTAKDGAILKTTADWRTCHKCHKAFTTERSQEEFPIMSEMKYHKYIVDWKRLPKKYGVANKLKYLQSKTNQTRLFLTELKKIIASKEKKSKNTLKEINILRSIELGLKHIAN